MKRFSVAIGQVNPIVGDLAGNTGKICSFIREAKRKKAQLVAFPELAITGYPPKDLLLKPDFVKKNEQMLKEIVKETGKIAAVVGFVAKVGSDLYNSAAVIENKRIVGLYHKQNLPNYDVFDEKRYFMEGKSSSVFSLKEMKIAVNICEDIWVEKSPISLQAKKGIDFAVNISASPFYAGKGKVRRKLVSNLAKKHKIPIMYVNLVGGQDDIIFDGRSYVFNSKGDCIFEAPQFCEGLYFPKMYGEKINPKDDYVKEIHDALVLGISDYVGKNGFEKVVIGVSGGIDSAVTAVLAKEALSSKNVLCVSMPSKITAKRSISDSEKLAKNLNVSFKIIPIPKIFDTYLSTLKTEFSKTKRNVTEENIQARIRGNILMALSNKFSYLVLSTGNKSELAVGYCTLYGDMAGGLAVISDVPKTTVYKLAEYINRSEEVIPRQIITRPPTAELSPGQKDTDSLPPYEVLDPILDAYIEKNKSRKEIYEMGFPKKVVDKVISLVDHNEYKRSQAAVGLRITPKAFGSGRRMPITNKYPS